MKSCFWCSFISLLLLLSLANAVSGAQCEDCELTVAVVMKALRGQQLYELEHFAGAFNDGHYTDPDPETRVKDYWSDGLIGRLDRDGDGHHETCFTMIDDQLVYVGTIGSKGTFSHTANRFKKYLGRSMAVFIEDLEGCQSGE